MLLDVNWHQVLRFHVNGLNPWLNDVLVAHAVQSCKRNFKPFLSS